MSKLVLLGISIGLIQYRLKVLILSLKIIEGMNLKFKHKFDGVNVVALSKIVVKINPKVFCI